MATPRSRLAKTSARLKRSLQFILGVVLAYLLIIAGVVMLAPLSSALAFGDGGIAIGVVVAVIGACVLVKAGPARRAIAAGIAVSGIALFVWSVISAFL